MCGMKDDRGKGKAYRQDRDWRTHDDEACLVELVRCGVAWRRPRWAGDKGWARKHWG